MILLIFHLMFQFHIADIVGKQLRLVLQLVSMIFFMRKANSFEYDGLKPISQRAEEQKRPTAFLMLPPPL